MPKVLRWVVGIAVVLLVAWGVLHVVVSPVNPGQEPPAEHVAGPCWACHVVTGSADVKDLDRQE